MKKFVIVAIVIVAVLAGLFLTGKHPDNQKSPLTPKEKADSAYAG